MKREENLENWEVNELVEPYISRGYFNEAIRKAIKIGWRVGIEYQKAKEEFEKCEKMKHNKENRRIVDEALSNLANTYDEEAGWLKDDWNEKEGVYILKVYTGDSRKNEKAIEEFNQTKLRSDKTIEWEFFKACAPGKYFKLEIPLALLEG